uniref:Uncharacterized protein n=1 Tax=Anguilla anguilla TaxID=7936 RepID=A0A0E9X5S9_ANGAN
MTSFLFEKCAMLTHPETRVEQNVAIGRPLNSSYCTPPVDDYYAPIGFHTFLPTPKRIDFIGWKRCEPHHWDGEGFFFTSQ